MSESAINKREFAKTNSLIDSKEEQKFSYQSLIKSRKRDRKNKTFNRKHINDCLCSDEKNYVIEDHLHNSNSLPEKNSYKFWNKLIEKIKIPPKIKNKIYKNKINTDTDNSISDMTVSSTYDNAPSTDENSYVCIFDENYKIGYLTARKNEILATNVKLKLKKLDYKFGCLEKVYKNKKNHHINVKEKMKITAKDKLGKTMVNEVTNGFINEEESYLSLTDNFSSLTTDIISKTTESASRSVVDVLSSEEEEVDKKRIDNLEKIDILEHGESLVNSSNSQGSNSNLEQRSGGLIYDDPLHSKYESSSDKESSKQIPIQTTNLNSKEQIKHGKKWFKDKDNDGINLGFIGNNLLTHTLIIAFIKSRKKISNIH